MRILPSSSAETEELFLCFTVESHLSKEMRIKSRAINSLLVVKIARETYFKIIQVVGFLIATTL